MLSAFARVLSLVLAAVIGGVVVVMLTRSPAPAPETGASGGGASEVPSTGAPGFAPPAFVPQVELAEITTMPAAERIQLGGYAEPRRSVRLLAQAPGRVTYVAGEAGERFTAGQVIIALDDEALQAQYRAAYANLSSQMTGIEDAQTQLYQKLYGPRTAGLGGPGYDAYERATVPLYNFAQGFMNQMFPSVTQGGYGGPFAGTPFGNGPMGGGSPFSGVPIQTQNQAQHNFPAYSAARAAYEQQLAQLSVVQSQIDGLDAQLRDRRSIAPWAGAIITRYVRVGDIVQPGQPLAEIADVDELDIRLEVPVAQVANLHVGDQVPVTINNANVWAPVAQIYPAANEGQHTVTVKLSLPAGTRAAPGMYALAWIAQPGGGSPSQLAPAIPTSAIVHRGSLPVAFAVDAGGNVEMRVLRLGDEQGAYTAVLSGLTAGERVVAHPSPDLKSGDSLSGRH